jgi:hypothetical protein
MPVYRFEFVGGPSSPTSAELDLADDEAAKHEALSAMAEINRDLVAQHIDAPDVAIEVYEETRLVGAITPIMLSVIPEE